MALKLVLAAAALVVAITRADGGASLAMLVLPAAAFLLPDALIARRATARARALAEEAPELLDRVRLAAEAGLSPERALAAGAAHGDGPLASEVRTALAAGELGLSRDEAFARLTARCPIPEVRGLAALVRRASRQGSSLGPGLEALARGSRAERARRLEERAQRAAPQIQLVVALVLVPAAMLLIGAALVATLV
jgi:tight adherence protein C